jgi:signal transduction histidine kinase
MKALKDFFTPPQYDEDTQSYSAQMLRVVLAFIFVLAIFYILTNLISDPQNALRYGLQSVFIFATLAGIHFLLRKGQPLAGAALLALSTWVIFTVAAFSGGGIKSSAYMGYLVVLTITALVVGDPRWTVGMAVLCIVSGYGLLFAEWNGYLPPSRVAGDSQSIWLDSIVYFGLVALLQLLAARMVQQSLRRARKQAQEKQEAEQREILRSKLLRRVIELGKEVTQAADLNWCLKKIHQSIQKGLGFERVGLFLYDENLHIIQGAYGTDRQGNIEDTSWFLQNADTYDAWQIALKDPDGMSFIKNYAEQNRHLPPGDEMYGVQEHVTLAAWSGKQPVALIEADNAITNRPISEESIEALRLFAGYAGLAITNARNFETINQELESFSYSVSHDLRSPLRAVVGFSKIILSDHTETLTPEVREYLQKINDNGRQMGALIDDLISFSRVGRQSLKIVSCDTQAIVQNIVENLQAKNAEQHITWRIGRLPNRRADYGLFQEVWVSLLENACKYTRTVENPTIEIGAIVDEDQVTYYIRDNGIGFEMQYASKIFRVFHRLHLHDEFEGTGVGLAIVHRIIQRHGGRVWAESEPGKGATFYFTLP